MRNIGGRNANLFLKLAAISSNGLLGAFVGMIGLAARAFGA